MPWEHWDCGMGLFCVSEPFATRVVDDREKSRSVDQLVN